MISPILNLGYGNVILIDKVVAVVNINSAPIKKMIAAARENSLLYDVSQGRKSRSAVITRDNQIFLTAIQTETLTARIFGDTSANIDTEE